MNTKLIDLHTHSTFSDGSMTPDEIVFHAKQHGLAAVALTDHDSVSGIDQAICAGEKYGVEVVPGIEFSVQSKTETHILGYYIDYKSPLLRRALDGVMDARNARMRRTEQKLKELGFDVTIKEVLELAPDGMIGRAHFARVMMNKGMVSSVKEAFEKYLGSGRPAYDNTQSLSAYDAVKLINDIGGVSFVAHPHLIRLGDAELTAFLKDLKAHGLDGIEGYYNEYTPEMQEYFQNKAKELGLAISGGTDFHAKMKPHIEIGIGQGNMQIPYSVLESIKIIKSNKCVN